LESALDTGFAYGLINDTEPAINQAQAGLTKNIRDENYRSSQTGAQPKTNKDGGTLKDCAEKIHNMAANKAPFMSGAKSAG